MKLRPRLHNALALLACALATFLTHPLLADPAPNPPPPILRPTDVIGLVGGEDMAALAESGQFEASLLRQPRLASIKLRSFAHEGDTVFDQHRPLNHPSWEQQLKQAGVTVLLIQFGKTETLNAAPDTILPAYRTLLQRLSTGNTLRLILLSPTPFEHPPSPLPDHQHLNPQLEQLLPLLRQLASEFHAGFIDLYQPLRNPHQPTTRNGIHLNEAGLQQTATESIHQLALQPFASPDPTLLQLIRKKNQLWYHYHRPQNWAFLHGDRTEQPSSRDHRNPAIRWMPAEMEQYPALIEAREREILTHLTGGTPSN